MGLPPLGAEQAPKRLHSAGVCPLENQAPGSGLRTFASMGHNEVWNSHPKGYGKGSREW